jgi:phage host-nuclease inhibitor protein Gam
VQELRQAQESGARLQHTLDMTKAIVEQRDQEQIALRRQLQNAGEIEKENHRTAAAVEGQIADLQKIIACREADLSRSMSIEGLDERTTRAVMTFKDRLSRGEDLKTAALGTAGYELTEVEAAMAQRDRDEMRALDALLKRPTWRRRVVLWLLDVRRSPNRQA